MENMIEVLGIQIDHITVSDAMQRVEDFLKTDSLSTVGIITMNALMNAARDPVQREYLEKLDLGMVGETEVLEAAGITAGQIYEQTEENEFLARFFWKLITGSYSFFLLGEDKAETGALETYVKETYPDIRICGQAFGSADDERSADWLVNEINGSGADVILSGLNGSSTAEFLLENRKKINGKIWLSFGEQIRIQNEAGIKNSWFGLLRKKNSFKRLVSRFRNEEND